MIYSYSYYLPQTPYGDPAKYNEYTQRQAMRNIADMMLLDFKFELYGNDHCSGQPQYRIELNVFSRDKFNMFLKQIDSMCEPWQSDRLHKLLKELEQKDENTQAKNPDSNWLQ